MKRVNSLYLTRIETRYFLEGVDISNPIKTVHVNAFGLNKGEGLNRGSVKRGSKTFVL